MQERKVYNRIPGVLAAGLNLLAATALAGWPVAASGKPLHPAALPAHISAAAAPAAKDQPRIDATIALAGFAGGLAVFARNGMLWLVAEGDDHPAQPRISGPSQADIGRVERVPVSGATVFRTSIPPAATLSVSHGAAGWQIRVGNNPDHVPSVADSALSDETGLTSLALAVSGSGKPIEVKDPEIGDTLVVIPAPPGAGYGMARRFVEFELLPAAQGVVVRPLADTVIVTADADSLSIGTKRGLKLSDPPDRAIVAADAPPPPPDAQATGHDRVLLDWAAWHLPVPNAEESRRDLEHRAAMAADNERAPLFLDLARLRLADGKSPETLGYLDLALATDSNLDARDDVRILRGAALALAGRDVQAEADLGRPGIAETQDAHLWHALDAARAGRWQDAQAGFHAALDRLASYPDPLYRTLATTAIETAIRTEDFEAAKLLIGELRGRPAVAAASADALAYFDGRIAEADGHADAALAAWKPATEGHDQYYRTRSEFASIETALKAKTIDSKQAIERLDRLRFAWRGDGFENEVLNSLGQIALEAKDYETAQGAFRQIAALAGTGPVADEAHTNLVTMFHALFIDGAADALPPLRALALFHVMRDLAPAGSDGDKALDRLAERMVQMDLLSQAADIVEGEAGHQSDAAVKSDLGTRAAALRLLDGKPELALRALDASETEGAAADVKINRKLLRARALSKAGRTDDALKLLDGDFGPVADGLRVDIGWTTQRWRIASDALGRLTGPAPIEGHLDEGKAALVLRRAVAFNLLQDTAAVAALRRDFAPSVAGTKSAGPFEVLTRPAGDGQLANQEIIRSSIAEVDMFKDFLAAYRGQPGGA